MKSKGEEKQKITNNKVGIWTVSLQIQPIIFKRTPIGHGVVIITMNEIIRNQHQQMDNAFHIPIQIVRRDLMNHETTIPIDLSLESLVSVVDNQVTLEPNVRIETQWKD